MGSHLTYGLLCSACMFFLFVENRFVKAFLRSAMPDRDNTLPSLPKYNALALPLTTSSVIKIYLTDPPGTSN